MNEPTPGAAKRLLIVLVGVAILAFAGLMLRDQGPGAAWLPGCAFKRVTGFECAGCGMTRAAHAALNGNIGMAFRFNPLGMVLLPMGMIAISLELAGWVRGRRLPWTFRVGGGWAWGIVGVVMVFWIARNIPAWPFSLLAPP